MNAKVVVVDDNPVTVRSLVQTIDWGALGCEIAGTAADGQRGVELILRVQPDILLLDIRMPQKDGLEMLQEIRQRIPECRVIIITGYDQFQYASQAIKLSVFDYILKPIRNAVVEEVVARALADIRQKRRQADAARQATRLTAQAQLLSLLMNESRSGQDTHQMLRDAGLYSDSYFVMLFTSATETPLPYAAFTEADALLTQSGFHAVTLFLYDTLVVYLMEKGDAPAWRETASRVAALLTGASPLRLHAAASALMTSHHHVRQAYQQARQAMWERTFERGEEGVCSFYRAQDSGRGDGPLTQMQRRVEKLVNETDLEDASVRQAAAELWELSGRQYSNLRALVSLYAMLLCKRYPGGMARGLDHEVSATLFVSGQEDVYRCLSRLCAALRAARDEQNDSQRSLMTRSVLEYIRLHAAEPLHLNEVADRFHINANYLSLLIKRETGTTFHEHVLLAKMDIAYSMLADPRVRVTDVALAVGYSSYLSFYTVFKRVTHVTPTEYRNQIVPSATEEEQIPAESDQ